MKISRNGWVVKLAFWPELIFNQEPPAETTLCTLLGFIFLRSPMMVVSIPFLAALFIPLFCVVWMEEKFKASKIYSRIKAFKEQACAKVKIE